MFLELNDKRQYLSKRYAFIVASVLANLCGYQNAIAQDVKGNMPIEKNLWGVFSKPESTDLQSIQLSKLTNFNVNELSDTYQNNNHQINKPKDLYGVIGWVLQRHPEISEAKSRIFSQQAYIEQAKANYYPQVSAGFTSPKLNDEFDGSQLFNINATQLVNDFGKTKTNVQLQSAKALRDQVELLLSIERISKITAEYLIEITRYRALVDISNVKIKGIQRLLEITQLRAEAGISSLADPIQAQSYLESAQTDLIIQETQLRLYQLRLNTLLGFDANHQQWEIPHNLLIDASMYEDPKLNHLPQIMLANADIDILKWQEKTSKLDFYPTLQLKADLSQALNGKHPTTYKHNGTDSSVMFVANSQLYRGGANQSEQQALQYSIQSAKARQQQILREIKDELHLARQNIEQKRKQLDLAHKRAKTTAKTKELYEEQYKLGTRSAVDLLNAELAVHQLAIEIESLRHDIFIQLAAYIEVTAKSKEAYHLAFQDIQGLEITP